MSCRPGFGFERILVDPVEWAIGEGELDRVRECEFHVNYVAIHGSIQDEMVPRRTIEREVCLPVFVVVPRERERFAFIVDGGPKARETLVHALKGSARREVKNHAAPAVVIGEEG